MDGYGSGDLTSEHTLEEKALTLPYYRMDSVNAQCGRRE